MNEIPKNCIAPLCTPDGASVTEKEEVENITKGDRGYLRSEMNSFNWFSFEYLNIPPKNIEAFKKTLTFILSEYKKSGFSYEKWNMFYLAEDTLWNIAPTLLKKDDIKLSIDWRIDPTWVTEELSQQLFSKNNVPITKKQISDLCNFLNTLLRVQ